MSTSPFNGHSPAIARDYSAMTSAETIVTTLNTFCGDGITEIRILDATGRKKRTDSGYFDDFDLAAKAVSNYVRDQKTRGVYFVVNPFSPELLARAANRIEEWATTTTADAAITGRSWLYVDCDPVRPAGISSTDDQVQQALQRAADVSEWLMKQGLCEPITAMSGNGAHLHFPISLPNDAESLAMVSGVLRTLDAKFSDKQVSIDQTVSNAARICRLYGTIARKGDSTADRTHRMARLLNVPDYIERRSGDVCDVGALQAIAAMSLPQKTVSKPAGGVNGSTWPDRRLLVPEYLRDAGIEFHENPGKGGEFTNYILAECPFNSDHKSPDSMVTQHGNGATGFKCLHKGCSRNEWQEFKAQVGEPKPEHWDPPKADTANNQRGPWLPEAEYRQKIKAERNGIQDKKTSTGIDFEIICSKTFAETDYSTTFLIDGIMTAGQPQLYGGPSKSLKTSVLLDQGISLAAGVPFLGRFKVPEAKRVLLLSSESGCSTLKETALRICYEKGIHLDELGDRLHWGFRPPMLTDAEHIATLAGFVTKNRIDVLGIDPAYLSMNLQGNEASSQFAVGAVLQNLTTLQADTGCTPILAAHFRMHMLPGVMPSLEHIAGAGFGQWARQWFLLNRREAFSDENPGSHKLLFAFGGSAGHCGAYGLDIEEGFIQAGRVWKVSVSKLSEIREQRQAEADDRKRTQEQITRENHRVAILRALKRFPKGETKTLIRNAANLNPGYFEPVWMDLLSSQVVEPCQFDRGEFRKDGSVRTYSGFRTVDPESRGARTHKNTEEHPRTVLECSSAGNG